MEMFCFVSIDCMKGVCVLDPSVPSTLSFADQSE